MRIFLYFMGILWVLAGAIMILTPGTIKGIYSKVLKPKNIKALSIVAFLFGLLFIFAFNYVSLPLYVLILGTISILKGLTFMLLSEQKSKELIDWFASAPFFALRLWGCLAIGLGLVLFAITI